MDESALYWYSVLHTCAPVKNNVSSDCISSMWGGICVDRPRNTLNSVVNGSIVDGLSKNKFIIS